MEKIFVTLWILFGIYILVLVMIMADLVWLQAYGGEARPVLQCANRPHDSR